MLRFLTFWFFPSLGVEEEKISTKNNEEWMTYTHKNEHEMESGSSHASTYFLTSHTNQVFFLSFSILLSNGALEFNCNYVLLFGFTCWLTGHFEISNLHFFTCLVDWTVKRNILVRILVVGTRVANDTLWESYFFLLKLLINELVYRDLKWLKEFLRRSLS